VWTQSLCQSFCYSELTHFAMMNSAIFCYSELNQFAIMLSYFMILSPFSRSCLSFCYSAQSFCKIAQLFCRFHQPFSKMTDAGVGARGGSMARSGWFTAQSVGRVGSSHAGARGTVHTYLAPPLWPHAPDRAATRSSQHAPTEPTDPARNDPCDSAIFYVHLVILLKCQSFCYSEFNYFVIVNLAILL
jgi:hypothetical protein